MGYYAEKRCYQVEKLYRYLRLSVYVVKVGLVTTLRSFVTSTNGFY